MRVRMSSADIAFGVFAAFLFGVLAIDLHWNIFVLSGVFLFAGMFFSFKKERMASIALFIFILALLIGAWYCRFYFNWQTAHIHLPPFNKDVLFSGIVIGEPQVTSRFTIVDIALKAPFAGSLRILAPPPNDIRYGDLLGVRGIVLPPDGAGSAAVFSPKITLEARHQGFFILELLLNIKHAIIARFNALLPADQAALLAGITLGFKADFSASMKAALAASGTTHIVAVSGYNITIVALAVERILGGVIARRKVFYATLGFVILFVLMTGVQASAVRAAMMAFLALFAREAGRIFNIRNAIAVTAVVMTIFDPGAMANNLGFSLSFLSLIGIVYLEPIITALFRYDGAPSFLDWKANGITTLSAQLGTMPVIVHSFGRSFSVTALLANILILSTVPPAMFFGFLLAAVGFVSAPLAFLVARVTSFLLWYELSVIKFFGAFAIPLPIDFSSAFTVGVYYAAFLIFVIYYYHGTRKSI